MELNPDFPRVLGPQVIAACRAGQQPGVTVGSPSSGVAQTFESTVTESVTLARRYWAGQVPNAFIMCEHLKKGQEIVSNRQTTVLRPTSSVQDGLTTWENEAHDTTGVDLYLSVNEATLNTSTFILTRSTPQGVAGRVSFGFTGATGILTGKRILAVRLHMVGETLVQSGAPVSALSGLLNGYQFSKKVGLFPIGIPGSVGGTPGVGIMDTGEMHPDSGGFTPWEVSQVQALATGQPIGLTPSNPLPETQNDVLVVYQLWIEIDSCDENRYMRDLAQSIQGGNRWDRGTAQNPATGSPPWSKTPSTDFTVLVRTAIRGDQTPQYATQQRVSVPYLPSIGEPSPIRDGLIAVYPDVTLNGDGTVASLGAATTDRMFGISADVSGVTSVDSQVYTDVQELPVCGSNVAAQTVTPGSGAVFDGASFAVAVDETAGLVSDLTVTVIQVSGGATVGSGVLTRDGFDTYPLDPHRRFWRVAQAGFDAPIFLTGGVQYQIRFTSPGPGSWIVQNMTTTLNPPQSPDGGPTFGGTGNCASSTALGSDGHGDLAVVLYAAPAQISGFVVSPEIVPIEFPDGVCGPVLGGRAFGDGYFGSDTFGDEAPGCVIDGLPGVLVGWDPVEDDRYFGYYEIQRRDTFTDWATVYRSDGDVLAFTDVYLDEYIDLYDGGYGPGGGISASHIYDWEARIGIESCYRIRQVNRLGIEGPWSDEKCATRPDVGIGYIFTSNTIDPLLFVAYPDQYQTGEATRSFTFPEADEVTYRRIYGRNNYIALHPTERRGVKFDRSLMVAFLMTPNGPQWQAFDALRDLAARTDIPYVAVCDESGGRVFASITVPDGQITNAEVYTATVRVVQIADLPSP